MEYLAALVISAATGWLLSQVGVRSIDSAVGAFTALVGGWRDDPWPRGVQEEDRDRPWGAFLASGAGTLPAAAVTVTVEDSAAAVPASPIRPRTSTR